MTSNMKKSNKALEELTGGKKGKKKSDMVAEDVIEEFPKKELDKFVQG